MFHQTASGCVDGIRVETDANIWSSIGDGVHCLSSDGQLVGKVLEPEVVSNLCFGGRAKHQLFIIATTGLGTVVLNRKGVQWP
jgi:gluconolactonase